MKMLLPLLFVYFVHTFALPRHYERWKLEAKNRFYISVTGFWSEPLVLETKAYCAFNRFLPDKFITLEEREKIPLMFKHLTPKIDIEDISEAYKFAKNDTKMEEINKKATEVLEQIEKEKNQTSRLRVYKDFVIYKDEYEDVDSTPMWTTFDFYNLEHSAQLNLTISPNFSILRNAIGHYREEIKDKWIFYNKTSEDEELLPEIQAFLQKRLQEVNYKIYIDPLFDLFWYNKLSSRFYSEHIREHLQKIRPNMDVSTVLRDSFFEVIGCAEKPMEGGGASIVLALRAWISKD